MVLMITVNCESCARCSWFEAHVEMHDNNMQCESPDGVIPGSPDSGTCTRGG